MLSMYAFQDRPLACTWSAMFDALTKQPVQSLLIPNVLPAASAR